MFVSIAFAENAASSESVLMGLAPLGIVFLIFYIFLIRPQNKKMSDHQKMLKELKSGDSVLTTGGISGSITKIDDKNDLVHLQVSEGVILKIGRNFILEKKK